MTIRVAQARLDELMREVSRSIVNQYYHQGIITVHKAPFEERLVDVAQEWTQLEFTLEGVTMTNLDAWWLTFKQRLEKGPRSNAKFETDLIDNGDTIQLQYCAVNNLNQGNTQDNVANYVKRHLRGAAKTRNQKIIKTLLNAHAAGGGGEETFPDNPEMSQGDVESQIKAGYKKPRSEGHQQKSRDIMKGGGSGAQGTVAQQRIKKALAQWEKELDNVEGLVAKGILKFQIWTIKGWFDRFFGQNITFGGKGWSNRVIDRDLLVQHTIVPNVHLNSGTLDTAIYQLFDKELEGGKKITSAFMRLAKTMKLAKLLDFWANSPRPIKKVTAISKKVVIDNLFPHKTNPNMRLKVNKKLYKDAKTLTGRKTKKKNPSTKDIQMAIVGSNTYKAKKKGRKKAKTSRGVGRVQQSPIALRNILNEMLPGMVASKMTAPALQFRTGRFANSAQVDMVHIGSQGGTTVDYTYMKEPYQTFEPGFRQGSTMRDPRKIIGESIRELATGILGRMPHTVRRT